MTEILEWKCPRCNKTHDGTVDECSCGYVFRRKQAKIKQESVTNSKFKNREEYEAWKAQRIKENQESRQSFGAGKSNANHYYEILELKPNATKEEIKQAYKDLLTVWNPDKFSNELSLQQKAREKVKEIDEAYEKLILYFLKSSERPSQSEKNTTQAPEEESNFSYTQSSQLSFQTATLTDGDYAAFVGKNADKYISKFKKFNRRGTDNFVATWHWPVFFAGFWWMLYRKLYLWALLYFVLLLIPCVDVVACIAFAITSNYIYYKHSKNKLLEIKQAQQSPRMQRDVAVRTGGVNSWVVTVMVSVVAGVAVIGILAAIMIPAYLGMQARARRSQAQTEVQKGDTFFKKGSRQEAIDAFSKAIELNPDDGLAYRNRGEAYFFSGDYKHAIEDLSKAIELNPQDSSAYYFRGLSYERLGNHQQYVIDCIKAARLGNKKARDSLSSQGIVWQGN